MIIAVLILVLAVVVILLENRYENLTAPQAKPVDETRSYQYHCAFLTEDNTDPFWSSILQGAKEEGVGKGIYVEDYGELLYLKYPLKDTVRMAMDSGVDAIIVQGDSSPETQELLNEAVDKGIVVVTIYSDNSKSRRQSFIGINNFQMGYMLASEAYKFLEKDDEEIMLLCDEGNAMSQNNTILKSGMQKYLDERKSKAALNMQTILTNEMYDMQERVRSLLRNESSRPRIVVCTTMLQTQCAYQTVVDLNCVGDVRILGFYTSDTIKEALEKGIVQATALVDTAQMGRAAVDNIAEYLEFGYSSDYTPVDITIEEGQQP